MLRQNCFSLIALVLALVFTSTVYSQHLPTTYDIYPNGSYGFGIDAERVSDDDLIDIVCFTQSGYGMCMFNNSFYPGQFYNGFSIEGTGSLEIKFGQLLPASPRKELAVANNGTSTIKTYIHSNYQLALNQTINVNQRAESMAWGRINDDDYEDLVCYHYTLWQTVYVYMNSNGTLSTNPTTINIGTNVGKVELVELDDYYNGDKLEELVTIGSNCVKIYKNNNGSYTLAQTITNGADDLAFGHFNRDNYLDMVTRSANYACFYINEGDGTFDDSQGNYQVVDVSGGLDHKIALGEYNYDGYADFAIANYPNTMYIYVCNGDGTFNTTPAWTGTPPPCSFPHDFFFADLGNKGAMSLVCSGEAWTTPPPEYKMWIFNDTNDQDPCPPKNFYATMDVNHHLVFHWAFNEEADIDGYKLYRALNEDLTTPTDELIFELIAELDDDENSYTDTDVYYHTPDYNYYASYCVRAFDLGNNESLNSDTLKGWVLCDLEAGGEAEGMAALVVESSGFNISPNPFNPNTTISFELQEAGSVQLAVYDISGREIVRLIDGFISAGKHQAVFDGARLSSGVYFAKLTAGKSNLVKKLLLVK